MPPLPFYHCRGHCDAIGHGNDSPFSRCTFASEFCLHALRKPFVPPSKKEGGGAPISAPLVSAPPQQEKPASVCGEHHRFLPQTARDQSGGALAFRRPTAVMRRRALPSTRLRAALPGITGSKREDPLRHQCSQHLAVRSRAGRSMPRTARTHGVSPRFREPLSFHFRKYPRERPLRERDGDDVIDMGTIVNGASP